MDEKFLPRSFLEVAEAVTYVTCYPLLKRYLKVKGKIYAQKLVEITETPKEVLKEPLLIEPSRYDSRVCSITPRGDVFARNDGKRRAFVSVSALNKDHIIEEVSHEIRNRIHEDEDFSVKEFFGLVGRILIKDPSLQYTIPAAEDLNKWIAHAKKDVKNLWDAMWSYRSGINNLDRKAFIRISEKYLCKKGIEKLKAMQDGDISLVKQSCANIITDLRFVEHRVSMEEELCHIRGYRAAIENREKIESDPKGIYLLSENDVRKRFFVPDPGLEMFQPFKKIFSF